MNYATHHIIHQVNNDYTYNRGTVLYTRIATSSNDIRIVRSDEVTGGWRNLHNEERHDLYSLPSIIRIMK
jgi:hypothetical protein